MSTFLFGKISEKNETEDIEARDFQGYSEESGRPFLSKPVTPGELISMMAKTLMEMEQ